jgi:Ca-activated chloride channel family protein
MDQDLIISWPSQLDSAVSTHVFSARHDKTRYIQLLVNPPAALDQNSRLRRELILIVDKSGSMAGVSMDAAIEALQFAIDGLQERDYLNIVAFDDQSYPLFARSQPVNDIVRAAARRFVDSLQADGGTEMGAALAFALDTGNGPVSTDDSDYGHVDSVEPFRQVVFMTDGSVGYEEQLLATIQQSLGNSRLFTVGIGPAPNTWFLQKAAEAGRGISLNILDEHDVARSITDLLTGMAHPVLTDIAVQYPHGSGEIYPRPIPDLYAGRPGMWVARISDEVDEIVITGRQDGQRWRQQVTIPAAVNPDTGALESSAPALAMHWTRSRIGSLTDEQRYAADRQLHKETITQLALSAGLVTPYTSFVAVESEPVRPVNEYLAMHKVANLMPKGNQMAMLQVSSPMQPVIMPRGAAGADTLAWLSVLLASIGLGLLRLGRRTSPPCA